jgi:hypothetical protein
LDRRFPRNVLLSHDLIEGAYVRAGLVTDIEVIDDYPSRFAAHVRRKHRWVRGDWQIASWLFGEVPDESGRKVPNPISVISRWKIFDNLRRSLVEPVTFLLLVMGWFVLPGGLVYWSVAVAALLLLPAVVQCALSLLQAAVQWGTGPAREGLKTFRASLGLLFLYVTFLPHQMLLSLDAIVRSALRLASGRNLLDWETAAQAEAGLRRSSLDLYLQMSPLVALSLAGGLFVRAGWHGLFAAGPSLLIWVASPLLVLWLDSCPRRQEGPLSRVDTLFLRRHAQHIWRFFAEFGGAANHWLIPDHVEEAGSREIRKLSPTNLGMLLNARQAAVALGFLTLPEFVEATRGTLATYEGLEKVRGHIYNWYDIETLKAMPPFTVSAVDSGNLAAAFYTLHSGALQLLSAPILPPSAFASVDSMLGSGGEEAGLLDRIHRLFEQAPQVGTDWPAQEAARRHAALVRFIRSYLPWLNPEFRSELTPGLPSEMPSLAEAPEFASALQSASDSAFNVALMAAIVNLSVLRREMEEIAAAALRCAEQMDFGFLLVPERQLLSVGYDGPTGVLHSACYDLLASEARMASFLAVAKGDIPQQAWFRLDRSHVQVGGRAALVSWTGTMFEYLMPSLWMRTFPNTLLSRAIDAAVRIQRDAVVGLGRGDIPWGISESGFIQTDANGGYGYQAFGVAALSRKYGADAGPVISPYSTFLALPVLRADALANLRRMEALGWTGAYGFYEAADYIAGRTPRLVRSWMAHHQGMSLLSIVNLLEGGVVQGWFHANPLVRSAALLLQERPASREALAGLADRVDGNEAIEEAA